MTDETKIETVRAFMGSDIDITDAVILAYLSKAEDAILSVRYPFGRPDDAAIESRWEMTQCELATRYILRRGAEGEVSHNENGINRKYHSVDDMDLLARITPYAKVI